MIYDKMTFSNYPSRRIFIMYYDHIKGRGPGVMDTDTTEDSVLSPPSSSVSMAVSEAFSIISFVSLVSCSLLTMSVSFHAPGLMRWVLYTVR